jgi:hypothetical protein
LKAPLLNTFPTTPLKADGQIVKAPFKSYHVEIFPAFRMLDRTFLTAQTSGTGSWKIANPAEEYKQLHDADLVTQGKARHLAKMLKAWKYDCNVELKSILRGESSSKVRVGNETPGTHVNAPLTPGVHRARQVN